MNEDKDRIFVTENMIADVVDYVRKEINHAGWDATWGASSTGVNMKPDNREVSTLQGMENTKNHHLALEALNNAADQYCPFLET